MTNPTSPPPAWRFIVRAIGGFHEVWPLTVIIHDRGLMICWRRFVQFDWPRRPALNPSRGEEGTEDA